MSGIAIVRYFQDGERKLAVSYTESMSLEEEKGRYADETSITVVGYLAFSKNDDPGLLGFECLLQLAHQADNHSGRSQLEMFLQKIFQIGQKTGL